MAQRPFKQVDVFTETPYRGNPLAVVLDGTGLSTEAMQQFTDWTNLSECTFVLPPTDEGHAAGADYRVRIFCPAGNCLSRATPRWAPATPGCRPAASPGPKPTWCRNAAWAWCASGAMASASRLPRRRCGAAARSTRPTWP